MSAPDEWARLVAALRAASSVLLISHRSPDGDTVGSALALAAGLRALGKRVGLACGDPIPFSLRFLEGWADYADTLAGPAYDLVVAVDCADASQMGALAGPVLHLTAAATPPLANLDHHRSNTRYGAINAVDAESASVAEMVHKLLGQLGVALTPTTAQALLTGIINDTHSFQNANSTAAALRAAAALVEAGAAAAVVTFHLFRSRRPRGAYLWGRVLPTLALAEGGRVASLLVTPQMFTETGADANMDTDGLVDILSGIIGVDLAMLIKATGPASSKASLRTSAAVDAVAMVTPFGGGGHNRAAGCDVPLAPAEAREALLEVYRRAVGGGA